MKRGGWILHWLLGLAGLGFLLASFHVVPPFIFSLDQWALTACIEMGYGGLLFGNLSLRKKDIERERAFTRSHVLRSLFCGVFAFLFCLAAWPFLEFPNEAPVLHAAVTTGGFALLSYFVGSLGFPVPSPIVLSLVAKLFQRKKPHLDQ